MLTHYTPFDLPFKLSESCFENTDCTTRIAFCARPDTEDVCFPSEEMLGDVRDEMLGVVRAKTRPRTCRVRLTGHDTETSSANGRCTPLFIRVHTAVFRVFEEPCINIRLN